MLTHEEGVVLAAGVVARQRSGAGGPVGPGVDIELAFYGFH